MMMREEIFFFFHIVNGKNQLLFEYIFHINLLSSMEYIERINIKVGNFVETFLLFDILLQMILQPNTLTF